MDVPEQLRFDDPVPAPSRGLASDRWASSRVELLLGNPDEARVLELVTFTPDLAYRFGDQTVVSAFINDCALGEQTLTHGAESTSRFTLPSACALSENGVARLRFESDNLLALTYLEDPRQLSYILKEIRWVTPP
jgi:hypothetical protein